MKQFNVYRNNNPATRKYIPFLLDIQADLFEQLSTRVVVPLVRAESVKKPLLHLMPIFKIEGQRVVMSTAELAAIPCKMLGEKVENLKGNRQAIIAAVDFLVTGF